MNTTKKKKNYKKKQKTGSTEIRTRILGFRVPGANHYTIEPRTALIPIFWVLYGLLQSCASGAKFLAEEGVGPVMPLPRCFFDITINGVPSE